MSCLLWGRLAGLRRGRLLPEIFKDIVTNSTEFITTSTLLAPRKRRKNKFSGIFPLAETFAFNRSLPNLIIYYNIFFSFFSSRNQPNQTFAITATIILHTCVHSRNFTYLRGRGWQEEIRGYGGPLTQPLLQSHEYIYIWEKFFLSF